MTEVPLKSLSSLCAEVEAFAKNTVLLSASMTLNHVHGLKKLLSTLHLEVCSL